MLHRCVSPQAQTLLFVGAEETATHPGRREPDCAGEQESDTAAGVVVQVAEVSATEQRWWTLSRNVVRQNSPASENAGPNRGLEWQLTGIAGSAIRVADVGRVRNGVLPGSLEWSAEPVRIRASRHETAVVRAEGSVFELAIVSPETRQEASEASGLAMTEVSRLPRTDSVQNLIARLLVPEPTTAAEPEVTI